jgi:hypothetical protein
MPEIMPSIYSIIPQEFNVSGKYHNPNASEGVPLHPFMCGVIGGSRTNKTDTAIVTMMKCDNFGKIEIYAKNTGETIYNWLTEMAQDLPEDIISVSDDLSQLRAPEEFDNSIQTLIIIDDFVLEKNQGQVPAIAQRGMKMNISLFYISQNFYAIDKNIRKNFNYLILKSINSLKEIKLIIKQYAMTEDPDEIVKMYKSAIKKKTDFVLVDLYNQSELLKFRKNFDMFYCPIQKKWLSIKDIQKCPNYNKKKDDNDPLVEKVEKEDKTKKSKKKSKKIRKKRI